MNAKVKFSTQVGPDLLNMIKQVAKSEGRQLQSIIEEALTDLLEKKQTDKPRSSIMKSYNSSHKKYSNLFTKLAK
ncbi:MAG: hypothetical protein COB02_18320 [Candidatus Cloacimonadota bacterium]|nr:MAG: hypothetical protein COB02_18320 [Candidatus Cloacimonadota bacterium]